MCLILYFLVTAVAAFITYCYCLSYNYTYWKKRNVPHPPVSYFFGNIREAIIFKSTLAQIYERIYKSYPSLSYVGLYKLRNQGILIRDPELIKEVLIASFNSFHDNDFDVDEKVDPLLAKNPFILRGERWKNAKQQVSPFFTGKRIKSMFVLMDEVCKKLIKYVEETNPGQDGFEVGDLAHKYSADVIANCGFGIEANSFQVLHNEFLQMTRKLVTPTCCSLTISLITSIFPQILKIFKIKGIAKDVENYFRTIISQSLKYREIHNVQRNDFLGLMNELKIKDKLTDDDIAANGLGMLFDGYGIASIVISFTLYELATHIDVQNKLKKEIDDVIERHGNICYNTIHDMPYLDKVLNETLRKHTPVPYFGKLCTQQWKFPAPDGNGPDVTIEPGTFIVIPISSIHNDAKYYQDPEKFDPERFSEKHKEDRPKGTFLPFGDGPRICIGQRFAIAQLKIVIVEVILNFEIRVNKKTILPLKIDPRCHFLAAEGGLWLDFHKRQGKKDYNN